MFLTAIFHLARFPVWINYMQSIPETVMVMSMAHIFSDHSLTTLFEFTFFHARLFA